MDAVEIAAEPEDLYRWSADEFMALIETGIIKEPRHVELLDGIIERTMPQGEFHRFIFRALNRLFSAMGGFELGMESIPPVILGKSNAIEPDFGLLSSSAANRLETPRDDDLLWAIEVSDATLRKDLGRKKRAYAQAGVPHYWVADANRRGVWVFSNPSGGFYTEERFVSEGGSLDIPFLGGVLDVGKLFPPSA